MSDITIPPEAVEAAAMQLPGMAGFPPLVEAAIRAALAAWPSKSTLCWVGGEMVQGIVLPLPQEPRDE